MNDHAILVIEHDEELAENLSEILELEGFGVEVVDTLEAARTLLATRSIPIVLTDLRLPDGTGLEMAVWIRQHHASTRVVVMSAFTESELREEVAGSRTETSLRALETLTTDIEGTRRLLEAVIADRTIDLLAKPFSPQALLTLVRQAL